MAYPPRPSRRTSYQQSANAGATSVSAAMVDAEHNDFVEQIDQLNTFVRGVTTSTGQLRNQSAATAQSLVGSQRFVATAAQTVFATTIVYSASFTATNVEVFDQGVKIDSSLVTVGNASGFLQVTLPAQTLNDVIFIAAFESGAGLLVRLANTASASDGASMVGVQDIGGLIAATTVEGALTEVVTSLNLLLTNLGTVSDLWKRNGTNAASANIPMGGFKFTGLADGSAATDSATVGQISALNAVIAGLGNTFVRKDGTTTMTGVLNAGNFRVSNVAAPTAGTDAANRTYVDTQLGSAAPVGVVLPFAGTVAPTGWLLCNGVGTGNRTTHATLFALIGTTYGPGDGTTTFGLPNPAGRTVVGAGTGTGGGSTGSGVVTGGVALSARAISQFFGEETHTLTLAETPAHTHTLPSGCGGGGGTTSIECVFNGVPGTWITSPVGNGTAHNVMQPSLVLSYIIKT